jgi:uncharacterized C2H2 Zn-finger protein
MQQHIQVTSSDAEWWPWHEMRDFEESLTCPICKEVIRTAMSLPCSHTFCSSCIRYALDIKAVCPLCKDSNATQANLRPNLMVDHIIANFKKARVKLVDFIQQNNCTISQNNDINRNPIKQVTKLKKIEHATSILSNLIPDENEVVKCPICEFPFRSQFINAHIDSCSVNSRPPIDVSSSKQNNFVQPDLSKRIKNNLLFDMMSLKKLKEKCEEFHLPVQADKTVLIKRLKEFIIEWNINVDDGCKLSIEQVASNVIKQEKQREVNKLFSKRINKIGMQHTVNIHNRLIAEVRERENKRKRDELSLSNGGLLQELDSHEDIPNTSPSKRLKETCITPPLQNSTSEEEVIELSPEF